MLNVFLITYDISSDRRRGRVADLLEGYGQRLQYSVFRCPLDSAAVARLKLRLDEVINHDLDQILLFDLGPVDGGGMPSAVVGRRLEAARRTAIII